MLPIHLSEPVSRSDVIVLGISLLGDCYSVDATKENGRMGRLVNHSRKQANVVTKMVTLPERPCLCLMAARDIQPGEELQYDYGDRSKAAEEAHPWLKC